MWCTQHHCGVKWSRMQLIRLTRKLVAIWCDTPFGLPIKSHKLLMMTFGVSRMKKKSFNRLSSASRDYKRTFSIEVLLKFNAMRVNCDGAFSRFPWRWHKAFLSIYTAVNLEQCVQGSPTPHNLSKRHKENYFTSENCFNVKYSESKNVYTEAQMKIITVWE